MSKFVEDKKDNTFIEQECTINFKGKQFTCGGSWLCRNIKTGLREGILYHFPVKENGYTNHFIGSWDGSKKVHAVRLNAWKNNFGDERNHFYFIMDGIKFYGISSGDNDIVRVKEYKNQD